MNVKYYNMTSVSEQYSPLTIDITASLSKAEKKADGIFITPRVIIKKLFDEIALFIDKTQLIKPYKILEPSCGTCEIVNYCDEQFLKPEILSEDFTQELLNISSRLDIIGDNTVDNNEVKNEIITIDSQ